ncbi:MAG: hypothetical protein GXO25_01465 [Euryarchaeota archaeon]|nr:hypothetical protein [Euryarchaeota archaeon]
MDKCVLVRELNSDANLLREFKKASEKTEKGFMLMLIMGIFMPLFIPFIFVPLIFLIILPIWSGGMLLGFITYINAQAMSLNLRNRGWVPIPNIYDSPKIRALLILTTIEYSTALFFTNYLILGYVDPVIFAGVVLILISGPVLIYVRKLALKEGYSVAHIYPGNVEQIANNVAVLMGGEKKMLNSSNNYKAYQITTPYSGLTIKVSRIPEKEEKTLVAIKKLRPENLLMAKELVRKINEHLEVNRDKISKKA